MKHRPLNVLMWFGSVFKPRGPCCSIWPQEAWRPLEGKPPEQNCKWFVCVWISDRIGCAFLCYSATPFFVCASVCSYNSWNTWNSCPCVKIEISSLCLQQTCHNTVLIIWRFFNLVKWLKSILNYCKSGMCVKLNVVNTLGQCETASKSKCQCKSVGLELSMLKCIDNMHLNV